MEHENLSGITVLDLSTVGPGSRCTAVLRDLGATVVKVLAPKKEGRIEPPSFAYGAHRRMKRARFDLRIPAGRDAFLRLSASADVVVESYRPGVAARLGIGYEDVRKGNDKVVYASLSGYGQDGPYAQWAGHDLNYLAVGGLLATQGTRSDGGPAIPGATIADGAGGGWHAALAICAALVRRSVTRSGQYLDVSTVEGVLALNALNVDEFLATGNEPGPGSTLLTGKYACYDLYECADGKWISVAAIEPKFFANLCRGLGVEHLAHAQMDEARQVEIRAAFHAAFATRDRDEWIAELAAMDTCVAPVLSIEEVTRDEHLLARGAFAVASGAGREFRQVGDIVAGAARVAKNVPVGFDETDSSELLASAGFSLDEIDSLMRSGAVE
ncbi:MAG: CoA transferase [Actinobacteria bacterium]|nr:CoA transferase [Actinomycetota bacterium]